MLEDQTAPQSQLEDKIIRWDNLREQENETTELERLEEEWEEREKEQELELQKQKVLTSKTTSLTEEQQLQKKADEIKRLYSLDYWMRCFNRVSFCNEIASQALFHCTLGQALSEHTVSLQDGSKLDWRLHFLWWQASGSGKGKAMGFVHKLMTHKKSGEEIFKKPFYLNDMTWEQDIAGMNKLRRPFSAHKLGRMNASALLNTYLRDNKGAVQKDELGNEKIKYGIIEKYDLIYSEEGRALLDGTKEALELQEIFMTAMETIGSENNKYTKVLTDYVEACITKSSASFIITTRPFGKIDKTLVESGMLQRFIFYPRKLEFEERQEMNKLAALSFKTKRSESGFEETFEKLLEELNKAVDFAYSTYIDFDEAELDDILSFITEKILWFTKDIEETLPNEEHREVMHSIVSRYRDNMVVMAFHAAVVRYSKNVQKQDVQYAFEYFKKLYEAQKLWLSISVRTDKEVKEEDKTILKRIREIIKQDVNELETYTSIKRKLAAEMGKSVEGMNYHLTKLTKGENPPLSLVEKDGKKKLVFTD